MLVKIKKSESKEIMEGLLNGDFQDTFVDSTVQDIERLMTKKFNIKIEEFSDLIYTNCYVGFYPFDKEQHLDLGSELPKNDPTGELYRLSFDTICNWASIGYELDFDEETNLEEIEDENFIKIFQTLKNMEEILPDIFEIRVLVDDEAIISGKVGEIEKKELSGNLPLNKIGFLLFDEEYNNLFPTTNIPLRQPRIMNYLKSENSLELAIFRKSDQIEFIKTFWINFIENHLSIKLNILDVEHSIEICENEVRIYLFFEDKYIRLLQDLKRLKKSMYLNQLS